ncbi:ATP-binding protein [Gracilibacillus timonensis]|uniref:ATP-binding protein n=1 Tax=Gracilibacillus timonensis TaxID=1816696 RepID=UPI000A7D9975|nr:ATP-binding protein [Gracilibacillus timonensis]
MLYDGDRITEISTGRVTDSEFSLVTIPKQMRQQIERHGFDIICISDHLGKIEYVSESVQRVLGFAKQEVMGRSIFRYLMHEDKLFLLRNFDIDRSLEHGEKSFLHLRNHLGRYMIFEAMLYAFYWNGERKVMSLLKDTTDQKQAEEVLIRSEKMSITGQLAAGIAHEIRNPLTSLKGFMQLLQNGISNKEEYYTIMMDEIDKIIAITSELLFLSKPMTNDRNQESINKMLRDVITLLYTEANLYNIDIVLETDEDVLVTCDCSQMKQVFINLIKNAIEEMEEGGLIHIVINRKESGCVISIQDQGPGIPAHLIDKLKEPFFTTKKNGTGLGLMICNQIITNHQGKLEIDSEVGNGSTFHIHLPFEVH